MYSTRVNTKSLMDLAFCICRSVESLLNRNEISNIKWMVTDKWIT